MSELTIRDLIHQIRTNDPALVSTDDYYYYSISDYESYNTDTDTTENDVALLSTILSTNTSLRRLFFENEVSSYIPPYRWQQLFKAVLCHNSIREVGFVNEILDFETTIILADILRYNPNVVITHLDLSRNEMMDITGVISILDSIKYNRVIEYLEFDSIIQCFDNASESEHELLGRTFREVLQVNTTLKFLGIGRNNLSLKVSIGLTEGLRTNTRMDHINYRSNNIHNYGAIQFAEVLRYNKTLTKLDLAMNNIGDDGAIAIAEILRYCNKTIQLLNIFENNITVLGYTALANVLITNTSLKSYGIGGPIDDTTMSWMIPFLNALQYNTTLKNLHMNEPESIEQWNIVYDKINEMIEYNDTVNPFWSHWRPHYLLNNNNPWRVDNVPNNQLRHAPKKGSRQRSNIYHWLFQTWI